MRGKRLVLEAVTQRVVVYTVVVLVSIATLFPIVWMFSNSVKPVSEMFSVTPRVFPREWTLSHYQTVWSKTGFVRYALNSMIVAGASTTAVVFFSLMAGYAVARYDFPGKALFIVMILVAQMFPIVVFIVPFVRVVRFTGIYNTYLALILPNVAFGIPVGVWLLRGFVQSTPKEIEEAAVVDGCGTVGLILRVVIPLVAPGLGSVALLTFLVSWSEFIIALTFVGSDSMLTLPIALANYFGQYYADWGAIMAFSVLYSVPVLLLGLFLQKYITPGLAAGAVKM